MAFITGGIMEKLFRVVSSLALTFLLIFAVHFLSIAGVGVLSYISVTNFYIILAVFPFFCYFTLSIPLAKLLLAFVKLLERKLCEGSAKELLFGIGGALAGVLIAYALAKSISFAVYFNEMLYLLVFLVFGSLGYRVGAAKSKEVSLFDSKAASLSYGKPKILDTSVIIDGRILDLLSTGFIEGKIIIPTFILEELRHIADSSDALKRNRGRLGLDVLNQIKNLDRVEVEIIEWMPPDKSHTFEVDIMLIKMAQELNCCVLTNDLNLNKVAGLHKVQVLNINELSNAVKSMVLPGQEMTVFIVKEGKEFNQGVAYLNDGTMIVIEDGKKFIETNVEIIVTSVLQTPAGRMIFGKYKG
jgi:uncharacterized protein YacL